MTRVLRKVRFRFCNTVSFCVMKYSYLTPVSDNTFCDVVFGSNRRLEQLLRVRKNANPTTRIHLTDEHLVCDFDE